MWVGGWASVYMCFDCLSVTVFVCSLACTWARVFGCLSACVVFMVWHVYVIRGVFCVFCAIIVEPFGVIF